MSNLKKIEIIRDAEVSPWAGRRSGDIELRITLDSYHHAILIEENCSATQLASDLHELAERIRLQEIKSKKKHENDIAELLRPLGDF